MGKIFCIIGKSASGKDTLYKKILESAGGLLSPIVTCTTRPIREGETDGKEYHFVSDAEYRKLAEDDRIIEERCYQTVYGPWRYFTADDGSINPAERSYLVIGTPDSVTAMRKYFRSGTVCPIYIEVDDGERLIRAVRREQQEQHPGYAEVARRFLSDEKDYAPEVLSHLAIAARFTNTDSDRTAGEILAFIRETLAGEGDADGNTRK